MNFTKKEFALFRKDVEGALQAVAKKHGVIIEAGNIRYDEDSLTMALKAVKVSKDVTCVEQHLFYKQAGAFGFTADDYLTRSRIDGKIFELYGFNAGSPKNCCKIRNVVDGREYKCSLAVFNNGRR